PPRQSTVAGPTAGGMTGSSTLAPTDIPPLIGAVASSIDEWREHVAAGRGISICPASAERYYARPDLTFVPADGVPPADLCVALARWRPQPRRRPLRRDSHRTPRRNRQLTCGARKGASPQPS